MNIHDAPSVIMDSADPEFARGAEIGIFYGFMVSNSQMPISYTVNRDNVENLLRVAEALERPFRATGKECSQGCHIEFRFEPSRIIH